MLSFVYMYGYLANLSLWLHDCIYLTSIYIRFLYIYNIKQKSLMQNFFVREEKRVSYVEARSNLREQQFLESQRTRVSNINKNNYIVLPYLSFLLFFLSPISSSSPLLSSLSPLNLPVD